ncbi:MAG: cupin domain-containing protein [bacterium]
MKDFPEFIKALPELEVPFEGVEGWLLQGEAKQVAFVHFEHETVVPEHSHAAQWELVIAGEVHLNISGEEKFYQAGQGFYVPAGVPHGAVVGAGFRSVIFFDQVDRYQAKSG